MMTQRIQPRRSASFLNFLMSVDSRNLSMPCYDCRALQQPEMMVFCRCTYAQCRNCWDKMCQPLRYSGRFPVCNGCQSDWQCHRLITYLQERGNQAAPAPEPVDEDSSLSEDDDSEEVENFRSHNFISFPLRRLREAPRLNQVDEDSSSTEDSSTEDEESEDFLAPAAAPVSAPSPPPLPAAAPVSAPSPPPVPAAAPVSVEETNRMLRRIGAGSVIRQNKRPGQDGEGASAEGQRKRSRGVTAGEVRCPRRRLGGGVVIEQRSEGLWEEVEPREDDSEESADHV
jgi:hypothetical protein